MNILEYPDNNELKEMLDFMYNNYKSLKIFQKGKMEVVYVMDANNNLTFAWAITSNGKKYDIGYFRYNKDSETYKNISILCKIYIKYIYDYVFSHPKEAAARRPIVIHL